MRPVLREIGLAGGRLGCPSDGLLCLSELDMATKEGAGCTSCQSDPLSLSRVPQYEAQEDRRGAGENQLAHSTALSEFSSPNKDERQLVTMEGSPSASAPVGFRPWHGIPSTTVPPVVRFPPISTAFSEAEQTRLLSLGWRSLPMPLSENSESERVLNDALSALVHKGLRKVGTEVKKLAKVKTGWDSVGLDLRDHNSFPGQSPPLRARLAGGPDRWESAGQRGIAGRNDGLGMGTVKAEGTRGIASSSQADISCGVATTEERDSAETGEQAKKRSRPSCLLQPGGESSWGAIRQQLSESSLPLVPNPPQCSSPVSSPCTGAQSPPLLGQSSPFLHAFNLEELPPEAELESFDYAESKTTFPSSSVGEEPDTELRLLTSNAGFYVYGKQTLAEVLPGASASPPDVKQMRTSPSPQNSEWQVVRAGRSGLSVGPAGSADKSEGREKLHAGELKVSQKEGRVVSRKIEAEQELCLKSAWQKSRLLRIPTRATASSSEGQATTGREVIYSHSRYRTQTSADTGESRTVVPTTVSLRTEYPDTICQQKQKQQQKQQRQQLHHFHESNFLQPSSTQIPSCMATSERLHKCQQPSIQPPCNAPLSVISAWGEAAGKKLEEKFQAQRESLLKKQHLEVQAVLSLFSTSLGRKSLPAVLSAPSRPPPSGLPVPNQEAQAGNVSASGARERGTGSRSYVRASEPKPRPGFQRGQMSRAVPSPGTLLKSRKR